MRTSLTNGLRTTIRNDTRNWNNARKNTFLRNKTRTVNLFSPQLPSPLLPLRWFYNTFHPFFLLCSVGESSCVQVSRGRLLSHMLNLVTLPTGLYYARGLILIFRMAAMATRPSSTLISQLFPTRLSTRTASFLENTVRLIHPEISMNLYRVIATEIERERDKKKQARFTLFLYLSPRVCKHTVFLRGR